MALGCPVAPCSGPLSPLCPWQTVPLEPSTEMGIAMLGRCRREAWSCQLHSKGIVSWWTCCSVHLKVLGFKKNRWFSWLGEMLGNLRTVCSMLVGEKDLKSHSGGILKIFWIFSVCQLIARTVSPISALYQTAKPALQSEPTYWRCTKPQQNPSQTSRLFCSLPYWGTPFGKRWAGLMWGHANNIPLLTHRLQCSCPCPRSTGSS